MRFASVLLMFFGYVLVYAAVAAGGKFATEPWASLFADAYTESTDPGEKLSPIHREAVAGASAAAGVGRGASAALGKVF